MKKRKGFTLIELLAIIVILAVIAVITVPIILGIVDDSKKGAVEASASGYKEAINRFYASELLKNKDFSMQDKIYTISELDTAGVSISGAAPDSNSWVNIVDNELVSACLQFGDYKVTISDGVVGFAVKGECDEYSSIPGVTINGVKYYDTLWIKENSIKYNPGRVSSENVDAIAPGKCTAGDDCRTWYPYSEFTKDGNKYVNMLLDRNTTAKLAWASRDDYMGIGTDPVSPSQNSVQNSVGISYPSGKTTFSNYTTNNASNEKGPLTLLRQLHLDTDSWNLPLRTDSYTPTDDSSSIYTIDYSEYKARLISAEEIFFITKRNILENPDLRNLPNSSVYLGISYTTAPILNSEQKAEQQAYSWLFDYTQDCIDYGCLIQTSGSPYVYGYWTSSPAFTSRVFDVTYQGKFCSNNPPSYTSRGLRPVITILKSDVLE